MVQYRYRFKCPSTVVIPYYDNGLIIDEDYFYLNDDEVRIVWRGSNIPLPLISVEEFKKKLIAEYLVSSDSTPILDDDMAERWADHIGDSHISELKNRDTGMLEFASNNSDKMTYLKLLYYNQ